MKIRRNNHYRDRVIARKSGYLPSMPAEAGICQRLLVFEKRSRLCFVRFSAKADGA